LPAEPAWLQQVHGTDVADLDVSAEPRGPADAAVAHLKARVCVIQVADCMPVLFAARDGSAVGAAHAGWRGLAAGVLEKTVRKLGVAPVDVMAWLGPTIGQANFEVGDDVRTAFMAGDVQAASAFEANSRRRWQCDLYALARRRLALLGISAIFGGAGSSVGGGGAGGGAGDRAGGGDAWCTYADAARYFSFRRDGQCGRMAALIWLE
jgi:YfiH family protein